MTDEPSATVGRGEAVPVVQVDAMEVDNNNSRGKPRGRRRSERQMVPGIDERMVVSNSEKDVETLEDSFDGIHELISLE